MWRALVTFIFVTFTAATEASSSNVAIKPVEADPLGFPYHVSIQKYDYNLKEYVHEGSGAILDENHIITSTFISTPMIYSYQIVSGILDLNDKWGASRQVRNLTKIFWNPTSCYVQDDMKNNNIVILRLIKPFEFDEAVHSIQLPPAGHFPVSTNIGKISGWTNTNKTTLLQQLEIPIISKPECDSFFGKYKARTGRICAAFLNEEGVALNADLGFDEGHPIICQADETVDFDHICGTFSFISPIVEIEVGSETQFVGGYPYVYSHLASYIPWINQCMTSDSK